MDNKPISELKMFTETLPNGSERLLHTFRWREVEVPAGFVFDGASAPRLFWSIIPPFKKTKKASCLHDWLCRKARNKKERLYADRVFKQALEEEGLNPFRVTAGYIGVRIGAFFGVGNHF